MNPQPGRADREDSARSSRSLRAAGLADNRSDLPLPDDRRHGARAAARSQLPVRPARRRSGAAVYGQLDPTPVTAWSVDADCRRSCYGWPDRNEVARTGAGVSVGRSSWCSTKCHRDVRPTVGNHRIATTRESSRSNVCVTKLRRLGHAVRSRPVKRWLALSCRVGASRLRASGWRRGRFLRGQ